MKTTADFLKDQLTANIVRSELSRGRTVYLCKVNETGETLLTSQPALWGGERVSGGEWVIAGAVNANDKSTYSKPIDVIDNLDSLQDFEEVEEVEEEKEPNYLIVDTTANHGAIYIGEMGDNCTLEENAMVFSSEKKAQKYIDDRSWDWAATMPTDFEVNMD